jgi:hypothetical protein
MKIARLCVSPLRGDNATRNKDKDFGKDRGVAYNGKRMSEDE